jgi:hypothetical protein
MPPRIGWGQNCGDVKFIKRGALLKIAAVAVVLTSSLILLKESLRNPSGFSVGPALPPGKVAPQLICAWNLAVLLAPDGSLWCWGATDPPRTSLVEEPTEAPQRIGTASDWYRVAASCLHALALKTDGTIWNLSLHTDSGKLAKTLEKLKLLLNQMFGFLPGHPQPFNPYGIHPAFQKVWTTPV